MKLFFDAKQSGDDKTAQRQKKSVSQQIVIISPRREIMSEIASQLLMHNLKNVVEYEADFFALQDSCITHDALAVIVDIVNVSNIEQINKTLTLLIPATSRQVLIGNSDSIAFAQELMCFGVTYLHAGSQLAQLAELIQEQNCSQAARTTMNISVLGCKGGAGASTVAYRLFQATGMLSSIPVMLVQGGSGSNDLDLLMARALPRDGSICQINTHQAVCIETRDRAWNYDDTHCKRFNLVFFDQGVYAQPQERLEMIISESHTIILVITRELAALRVAKNVMDENRRIMLTRPARELRILICLNENHPAHGDELKDEDIEAYLGCKIFTVNPYRIKSDKLSTSAALYRFAAHLLGKPVAETPRKKLLPLPALLRRRSS